MTACLRKAGDYHWRKEGEHHQLNPKTVAMLQHAVRSGSYALYKQFAHLVNSQETNFASIRGLMKFKKWQSRSY